MNPKVVPPLEGPRNLTGERFLVNGEEFAMLSFELPTIPMELPSCLTAAEVTIVRLVLEGLTNEGISKRRGKSVRTVANQLQSIYRKLGVTSRLELIRRLSHLGSAST